MWNNLPFFVKWFGIVVYLTQILSYFYTFLKNPGIPKNNSEQVMYDTKMRSNGGYKFCNQCHIFINTDNKVNHCEDCNVCIEGKFLF